MKDRQPDGWRVPFPWFGGDVWLYREVIVTKAGVGARLSIHPATIVQARYNGSYEEAPWLCFPLRPAQLLEPPWREWDGAESACASFWHERRVQGELIGRGDSPAAAYDNLIDQACTRVGVDRSALTEEPRAL